MLTKQSYSTITIITLIISVIICLFSIGVTCYCFDENKNEVGEYYKPTKKNMYHIRI